ncbi:hypothetical protein [Actinoplanes sp. NPDC049599]|uniref:hypothetical protein n=1 Tax=Actinoplanes sp. NPDC049599 TaxID=3363903 RepID=UPI003789C222
MLDLSAVLTGERENEDGGSVVLSSADLEEWWLDLTGDKFASRQGLQILLDVVKNSQSAGEPAADFHFTPAGWEVRLSRATAKGLMTSAILAGLLAIVGADQLPAEVLAVAIPLLFDVEKVELSRGERYLLARLVEVPGAVGKTMEQKELYALLPDDIREQTSFIDFVEFLDAFHKAGQADLDNEGGVLLRELSQRRFRLTFR